MTDAYEELLDRWRRLTNVYYASRMLNWDEMVVMPEGGTPARSEQLSALASIEHELMTDDGFGDLLADAERTDLAPDQEAVVREIRRYHDREVAVPGDLVEELQRARSEAYGIWESARDDADFDAVVPHLSELVELHVERAEHIAPEEHPYAVMHEDSLPYIDLGTVEDLFSELREALVPLIDAVRESDVQPAAPFEGAYDEETQRALCEDALEFVGYDRERGRLDACPHPMALGTTFDARITTRYEESDPLFSLYATLHEFGHAAYLLGLPEEAYATPLGERRERGVDESQARFFENHVGRTRAFWEAFLPRMKERFPRIGDVTPQEAYEAANRVHADNPIRTEADELTYHMHVILRFEIEREFVGGDLDIEGIPDRWGELMEEYLGVRPGDDAEGPLQAVNWTASFADFQSYTVGSVLAAQLDAAMREELDVDGLIREGEIGPIREWLTDRIHRHGQRYRTQDLIEEATGEPLTAEYFIEYVETKFGDLYDI